MDKLQTLQNILNLALHAKEAKAANRLKLKWGDKEIDVQETADRLVGWITKFKEVGDIAAQYDPVHATLPWAGVRFILLVRSTVRHCTLTPSAPVHRPIHRCSGMYSPVLYSDIY